MAINLADSAGRPLNPGDLVTYHGSIRHAHGQWEVHRVCNCLGCTAAYYNGTPRMILRPFDYSDELECVRPESVTLAGHPVPEVPVTEMWQACAGDVIDVPGHFAGRLTVTFFDVTSSDPEHVWVTWAGGRWDSHGRELFPSATKISLASRPGEES